MLHRLIFFFVFVNKIQELEPNWICLVNQCKVKKKVIFLSFLKAVFLLCKGATCS